MENKRIRRGQIWICKGENGTGSEQKWPRPVLIVSNNKLNKYGPIVNICCLTSQTNKDLPVHYRIPKRVGLKFPSVVLCEHTYTVDKSRLINMVGELNERELGFFGESFIIEYDIDPTFSRKEKIRKEKARKMRKENEKGKQYKDTRTKKC